MTLEYLENKILSSDSYPHNVVTKERIAGWLCGENRGLAEQPFSKAFLENVAYNSKESMYGILWLQLNQWTINQ